MLILLFNGPLMGVVLTGPGAAAFGGGLAALVGLAGAITVPDPQGAAGVVPTGRASIVDPRGGTTTGGRGGSWGGL